jgi:dTDP-D-glucose 4,6-dehydratase
LKPLLLRKGKIGDVYNICSSGPVKIGEILRKLLEISGVEAKIKVDRKKFRPTDEPVVVGDSSKIKRDCGWKPKVPFEKMLESTLNYWREQYDRFQEKKQLLAKMRFLERELAWAEVIRRENVVADLEANRKKEQDTLNQN